MTVMAFASACLAIAVALSVIMAGAWLIQQRTGNSGWVDTVWTFGLGLTGTCAALLPVGDLASSWRGWVVAAFLFVWSLRLGLHIAQRTRGINDDPRYAELIRGWSGDARRQMFWLLQKQALVSIPLAVAALLAGHNPDGDIRLQDILAIIIMAIALGGEALADRQLRQFRLQRGASGGVCDAGLWRYSRHPNYFFEWLGWTALPLLAIDMSGAYSMGLLSLLGPACMYWLLTSVSGIPPLEEHMLRTRGDAYRTYQARTSAFFPRLPRNV